MVKGIGSSVALAAAALLLLQLPLPALGSSELFKTSSGDTFAELRIGVPPGFNDSLSFTLPSESLVQSARFQLSAMTVTIPAQLTDAGSAFLNGSRMQDLAVDNGMLRLADQPNSAEFSDWPAFSGCMTATSDGCLTLARDIGRMYFTRNMRPSPSSQAEYEPVVAVGAGDEVYAAWTDQRDFDFNIYFTRSLDRGTTFMNATRLNDDTKRYTQQYTDIAAGPGRTVAAVWTDNRSGDEDIYIALSNDSGASFSANRRVDDGPPGTNQTHPSIAVAPSGKMAVAWEDDRSGKPDIRCAFSDDGRSFGPSVQLNTDPYGQEQLRPRLAAGSRGFHAVWYGNHSGAFNNYSEDFNVYYARSSGNGFLPEVRVDDSNAGKQALPSVAAGPQDKVHVVWHDTRLGYYRVFYSYSQDGVTFSVNSQVNPQTDKYKDQYQPRIRVGADGVLHVVWHDYRNGEPDIYYENSTNSGLSFNGPVRVDDAAIEVRSLSPALAVDSLNMVHVVWWDNRTSSGTMGYTFQTFYSRGVHPYFPRGAYETAAVDLGTGPSDMTMVCATASQPNGTTLRILIRTASGPDGGWSGWENVGYCATRAVKPAAKPGQLIQWRFELETIWYDFTPSISSVALSYSVHPPSGTFLSRPVAFPYALRGAGVNWVSGKTGDGPAELSLRLSADNGSSWSDIRPGLPVQFSGSGRVLLYRIGFNGSSSTTPTLSSISFDLRLESLPSDVALSVGRSSSAVWVLPGPMPTGEPQASPELQDPFNRAILEARKAGREDAVVRINISSGTPGTVKVGDIRILYDLPPVFTSLSPDMNVGSDEGGEIPFTAAAADPDNDPLSIRWTLDGSLAQAGGAAFVYRPDYSESGFHNLTVSVSDGVLSASYSWAVTVRDVNRPPEVTSATPEDRTAMMAKQTARFEVKASDPDGDFLSYSWYLGGSPVQSGQDYLDFTAPVEAGAYGLSVNISDGKNSTTHSWIVDVSPPLPPTKPEPAQISWPLVAGILLLAVAAALAARLALDRRRRRPRRRHGTAGAPRRSDKV